MSEFEDFDNPVNESFEEEPQTMSLMGGIAGGGALPGDEFAIGGNESKKLTQQSILIGLTVTVVAFGALTLMRVTQKDASAADVSAETMQFMTELDIRIANMDKMSENDPLNPVNIKRLFQDTDEIVAAIEDDPTEKQVPLELVQMNPFTLVQQKTAEVTEAVDSEAMREAERSAELQNLYGELARIEIQSLVGGKRPAAFIGGDLFKVGDKIGSFVITQIDNRRIVFDAPGFELRDGETSFALGIKTDR
ncbi:hypothetical protein [Algisphaera agarilytica]|uniref:Uncharacterized protein n=1 Tax=Algisphaera agarilytica TaxID=1385975 RepID=A0A7X0H8S2_9BACT|nr:hypothetical protein [Algisphaera agarilytica]MBB6431321.1 hypothetical protein [Algisphaera agarilytica]